VRHVPGLACREQDVVTPISADTRSDQSPGLALRALLFHSGQRNAAASKGEPGAKAERIPERGHADEHAGRRAQSPVRHTDFGLAGAMAGRYRQVLRFVGRHGAAGATDRCRGCRALPVVRPYSRDVPRRCRNGRRLLQALPRPCLVPAARRSKAMRGSRLLTHLLQQVLSVACECLQ
jgi:hypothetical protein